MEAVSRISKWDRFVGSDIKQKVLKNVRRTPFKEFTGVNNTAGRPLLMPLQRKLQSHSKRSNPSLVGTIYRTLQRSATNKKPTTLKKSTTDTSKSEPAFTRKEVQMIKSDYINYQQDYYSKRVLQSRKSLVVKRTKLIKNKTHIVYLTLFYI